VLRRRLLIGAGITPLLWSLSGRFLAQAVEEVGAEAADPELGKIHVPPAAMVGRGGWVEHHGEELRMPCAVRIEPDGLIETLGNDVHGSPERGIVLVSHTTATPTNTELRQALRLINNERARNGRDPLTLDPRLSRAAQRHAKYLNDARVVSHTGSGGSTFVGRIEAAGYKPWRHLGENVAQGYSTWSSAMAGWMRSSGHRANILSRNFRNVGLGRYNHYYVQDFGAQ
jgi:hypothetical protein